MQRARNTPEERCRIFGGYGSGWGRVDDSHGALKIAQRRSITLDVCRKQSGTRKDEKHVDKRRQRALRFATLPSARSALGEGLQIKGRHERKRGIYLCETAFQGTRNDLQQRRCGMSRVLVLNLRCVQYTESSAAQSFQCAFQFTTRPEHICVHRRRM